MRWIFLPAALVILIIFAGLTLWINYLGDHIPDDRAITDFTHNAVTVIYDRDGDALASLQEDKNQIWVPLSGMSDSLKKAVIATEDPYFFKHSGIDYRQTWESLKDNLRVWRLVRGGSTITQQVAKNVYLSNEKTLTRKIKEYFLANKLESLLPKERILEMYLNEAGWGYGIYGVELASRYYLDKHAQELTPAESAFLIALLRNPVYYNPYKNKDRATKRQRLVLTLMLGHRLITKEEYGRSLAYAVSLRLDKKNKRFHNIRLNKQDDRKGPLPCYEVLIEGYLSDTFGRNLLYDVGLEVYTTIDASVQDKIEEIIEDVDRRNKNIEKDKEEAGVVLILDSRGKVRAIGCAKGGEEVSLEITREIKRLDYPFNLYTARVTTEKDIIWRDILLISKGERLL